MSEESKRSGAEAVIEATDDLAGHLWICSSYDRVVSISDQNVISLAFGKNHCLFLTARGVVYSFGSNLCGQLGIGNLYSQLDEPQVVHELPPIVASISCGPTTSAVLTQDGSVYMWGDNSQGQCAQSKTEFVTSPKAVNFSEPSSIDAVSIVIQIACGAAHTLALTSLNQVWIWGTPSCLTRILPKIVVGLSKMHVISVACGLEHSLAVVLINTNRSIPKAEGKRSKAQNRFVKLSESSSLSDHVCPLGLPFSASSPLALNNNKDLPFDMDTDNQNIAKEVLCDIINCVVENQSQYNQNSSEEEMVTLRRQSLTEGCQDNAVKRTGSFIDPQTAKEYLEKLTVGSQASPVLVSTDSQEMRPSKIPYVWGAVTRVRNSFDRLSLSLGNVQKAAGGNKPGSDSSTESFEVVETNLIDIDNGVIRSGSFKSLLELKQASRSRTKNTSLEVLSLQEPVKKNGPAQPINGKLSGLQTEVWSWGKGLQGQLGHGDEKSRNEPCCVLHLNGQGITKVLAGGHHSLALTLDGRLFTWGSNSRGQLGHSFHQESVHTPRELQLPEHQLIWDASAGEEHTLLLVDAKAPRVVLYSCGGHSAGVDQNDSACVCPKEKGLYQLNILKKSGLVLRVYSGGPRSGCLVSTQRGQDGYMISLHQWAASERWFLHQLNILQEKLLLPLLRDGTIPGLPSICKEPFQNLISCLSQLTDLVALSSHDLTLCVLGKPRHKDNTFKSSHLGLDSLTLTSAQGIPEWIQAFWSYFQALSDIIAVSAATALTNEWSITPGRLKMLGRDTMGEAGLNQKSSSEILLYLLQLPARRTKEYIQLIGRVNMKKKMPTVTEEALSKWQQLVDAGFANLVQAEKTRLFWESSPNKLTEAYRVPNRRLIRESKTHPMSIQSSGLFSSHWFILFSDILVHSQFGSSQYYPIQTAWVEPLPDDDMNQNAFILRLPEDIFTLTCPNSAQKTEWVCTLNWTIKQLLDWEKDPLTRLRAGSGGSQRLSPPLPRQATYTFSAKTPSLKDAVYTGMWLCGKIHGHGQLTWADGRVYVGKFKQNLQDGEGTLTVPQGPTSSENPKYISYEGQWKDGKLNGFGSVRYPNGDLYEGFFRDDQRHGYGMLKQGVFTSASLYVGEWSHNQKSGYGVLDRIHAGEKYMGHWAEDQCHGNGVVVTIDGVYYEGPFLNGKLQGSGLMLFEDGTRYQGELGSNGTLNGKGNLYMSNGDTIEGTFSGIWSEGFKINGQFHKATSAAPNPQPEEFKKFSVGLCVEADQKWEPLFTHCLSSLNIIGLSATREQDNRNAWEAVAIMLHKRKKGIHKSYRKRVLAQYPEESLDYLEHIPHTGSPRGESLNWEEYQHVVRYLSRACDCPFHPLGTLVDNIVDVYRASYSGVGAHPCLLQHAVDEAKSFFRRFYPIVRILFPDLPAEDQHYVVRHILEDGEDSGHSDAFTNSTDSACEDLLEGDVVSGQLLIQQTLMPKLYQPLFTLYALHNETEDEQYWKRLVKWNRQADIPLMNFLGVDPQFWLCRNPLTPCSPSSKMTPSFKGSNNNIALESLSYRNSLHSYSSIKDEFFASAVEMLQHISSQFSPMDKLKTIHKAFQEISKEVQNYLGSEFLWTMDYLFPVFQYVVVRARICHLGSEIHFIDDLMEKHFEMGELGIMFTTLKACYFQIRTEKLQI